MIELTQQQHDAVEASTEEPIRAVDPATSAEYVLLRAEPYARLKAILSDEQAWGQSAYAASIEAFARDGWDDPHMDIYNSPPMSGRS